MDTSSIQHKPSLSPGILERCRSLRKNAANAENLLWQLLRNRQLMGFKFRRQHPIAGYVADFYFHEARLVIELDGGGHAADNQSAYDADRTRKLEVIGLRVMRFWNNQVLQETQAVLETIAGELMSCVDDVNQYPHPASPNPLAGALRGERRSALRNLTELKNGAPRRTLRG